MKGKIALLAVIVCFILTSGAFSIAKADTILFPVIAVNKPWVTTIVSVFNRRGSTSSHLRYIYRTKDSLVMGSPNYTGDCVSLSFIRNTFDGDLVSFDASGVLNGGNALFNDPNTYNGDFSMGDSYSGPRRGYLLVTNSDASGTSVDVGHDQALGGEAIVMDIATGAAWGYRAINDTIREDFAFTLAGVSTVMSGGGCKWFSFFPTNDWSTKFFVTPFGGSMNTAVGITTKISLYNGIHSVQGVTTRGGTAINFTNSLDVTCTGAVDLADMLDATALAAVQNIGGWAWLCEDGNYPIVVYKLEYVVNNPTYGGTNNNGYLLSTGSNSW